MGKLSLAAGLRWENVRFDYYLNGERNDEASRRGDNLSPDISLNYQINKNAAMSLNYSQTIVRPAYTALRNSLLYVGKYEIEGGNPELKDCREQTLDYMFSWKDLMLNASYVRENDKHVFIKEHYGSSLPLLVFHPVNVGHVDIAFLNASYSPKIGVWNPVLAASLYKQWLDIDGEAYDKPHFQYMLKNLVSLPKGFLLSADISGCTRGDNYTTSKRSYWGIDLSVRKYFLGKRLQVNLAANDVFNTRNTSYDMAYKDVVLNKTQNPDSRSFMLAVSYMFNQKRSGYKGQNAVQGEMNRL